MGFKYIIHLAYRQLISRPAGSLMSIVLFAIGVALISFLLIATRHIGRQFEKNLAGIDLVVGAKGSPLQLILSTVMHIDYPTGNIDMHEANMLSRNPLVSKTIPIALGDNFMGYRIVGTTTDYASHYGATLLEGRWQAQSMEVCIGYQVASRTGLAIGDSFTGVHGLQHTGHAHDEHPYTVTGILQKTGTVIDNLILTPVESVWMVHGSVHPAANGHIEHDTHDLDCEHDHDDTIEADDRMTHILGQIAAGEDISADDMLYYQQTITQQAMPAAKGDKQEITALLVTYRSPAGIIQLPRYINENTSMQAASPALEINRLFSLLGFGFDTLRAIAWIIILISAMNIFVHLFNALRQGMFQIALIRILGGSKPGIFLLVIAQGLLLAISGWVLGLALSRLGWVVLSHWQILPLQPGLALQQAEVFLLLYACLTGILGALLPAIMAYRIDVHKTLRNNGRS